MMGGVFPIPARRYLAEFLHSTAYGHPVYLAWGTGTNDITIYDTRLYNEMQRAAATVTKTDQYLTITYDFTITATTAGTAAEAGLFDASAGGVMYWRGGFHSGAPAVASSGYYQGTARTIVATDILRVTQTFYLRQT
jgi:hypothetical protein